MIYLYLYCHDFLNYYINILITILIFFPTLIHVILRMLNHHVTVIKTQQEYDESKHYYVIKTHRLQNKYSEIYRESFQTYKITM